MIKLLLVVGLFIFVIWKRLCRFGPKHYLMAEISVLSERLHHIINIWLMITLSIWKQYVFTSWWSMRTNSWDISSMQNVTSGWHSGAAVKHFFLFWMWNSYHEFPSGVFLMPCDRYMDRYSCPVASVPGIGSRSTAALTRIKCLLKMNEEMNENVTKSLVLACERCSA